MERPRRQVRSIYATRRESETEKSAEHHRDDTASTAPSTPRTVGRTSKVKEEVDEELPSTQPPLGSVSPAKAHLSVPAPSKRVTRSSESSTASPHAKRAKRDSQGGGGPSGEGGRDEDDSYIEVAAAEDEAVARAAAATAVDDEREPHLEEVIVEERASFRFDDEDDESGDDAAPAPPALEMCGGDSGGEEREGRAEGNGGGAGRGGGTSGSGGRLITSGGHSQLLIGAISRGRGRPINSRKSYLQRQAEGLRAQRLHDSSMVEYDDVDIGKQLIEEENENERRRALASAHGGDSVAFLMSSQDILTEFYEPQQVITELGDRFLKVRDGALAPLLKRDVILALIVNDTDRAEQHGWVNAAPPSLPPLTTNVAAYVTFVDTKVITEMKSLTTDALSPWSSSQPIAHANLTPTRPKVRKFAVFMRGGEYCVSNDDWRGSLYILVEYSALLPRLPRLRKRVYYMMRDRTLLGLAMYIYDYIEAGPIPSISYQGNTRLFNRQRMEMVRFTDEEGNKSIIGVPVSAERSRSSNLGDMDMYDDDFDDIEPVDEFGLDTEQFDQTEGPFGSEVPVPEAEAIFLRVPRPNFTYDKAALLKYLVNETDSIPVSAVHNRKPSLPPLVQQQEAFACFVPGKAIVNQCALNTDALSPWTSSSIRPKTRKLALEQNDLGEYALTKKNWRLSNVVLVEMCTTLARCPRLRKRIYYVMRNNLTILGYVLFMYEYTAEGELPEPAPQATPGCLRAFQRRLGRPIEARPAPIRFYTTSKVGGKRSAGDMDDMVDVMDIGEEVEVDLMEENDADEFEEVGPEEFEGPDDNWMDQHEVGDIIDAEVFDNSMRQTATGDRYIVARTRRIVGDKNLVLKYVINDARYAADRGVLLHARPWLPPLSSQAGIFCFFVTTEAVDLTQVNRDGLSPWSSAEPGKQIRPKVKRYAVDRVVVDAAGKAVPREDALPHEGLLRVIREKDPRDSPFQLVQLHSALPRCPRLLKKVFYLLDNASGTPVGNMLIIYEYTEPGPAPQVLERPSGRRHASSSSARYIRPRSSLHDENSYYMPADQAAEDEEYEDMERECPFDFANPETSPDNCICVPIIDPSFLLDRNRQLLYCVHKANVLESQEIVNDVVPLLPPLVTDKADFCFFVNGRDMDPRNLTCDGLAPWSDSRMTCSTRPKSRKLPVDRSPRGRLRYMGGSKWEATPYQLVVYYAVLPRCPRLKKRIIYVLKDNEVFGHILVIYSYTEPGSIPHQVPHGNSTRAEPFYRMPPSVRDEARRLLEQKRPSDVLNALVDRSPSVSSRAIYNISKAVRGSKTRVRPSFMLRRFKTEEGEEYEEWVDEMHHVPEREIPPHMTVRPRIPGRSMTGGPALLPGERPPPGSGVHRAPTRLSAHAEALIKHRVGGGHHLHRGGSGAGGGGVDFMDDDIDVVADGSMEVAATEEVALGSEPSTSAAAAVVPRRIPRSRFGGGGVMPDSRKRDRLLEMIQRQTGATTEDETLDMLWEMFVERNEQRVLQNIRRDFGVEIVTNVDEGMEGELDMVEGGGGGGDVVTTSSPGDGDLVTTSSPGEGGGDEHVIETTVMATVEEGPEVIIGEHLSTTEEIKEDVVEEEQEHPEEEEQPATEEVNIAEMEMPAEEVGGEEV